MSPKGSLKQEEVRKYLGIDYGKSKIGLAIADSETGIAFAYGILKNNREMADNLAKIINSEKIHKVVIGVPRLFNGGETANPAEKLGAFISEKLGIFPEYENEMYSTKVAERNIAEKGLKNIKKYDDQEAARIILQSWLDKRRR